MFQHILYGIVSPGCCVGISTYGQDIYEGVILQAFLVIKHLIPPSDRTAAIRDRTAIVRRPENVQGRRQT